MKNPKPENPLARKVKLLPEKPGVYVMTDKNGSVIYVGKAKSLKKRVASYFSQSGHSPKTERLVKEIFDIKHYPAKSEVDALVLEFSLIKRYKPRFNIEYKDDKSYPFIKITKEPFPSISLVRILPSEFLNVSAHSEGKVFAKKLAVTSNEQRVTSNCIMFGPYPNVRLVKDALRKIRKIFPVRECGRKVSAEKTTAVCLDYHVGLCAGPCQHMISEKDYKALVRGIYLLLKGEKKWLARDLRRRMEGLSRELKFEDAARVRNQLLGLKELVEFGPEHRSTGAEEGKDAVLELKNYLKLKKAPLVIEGLDISNIGGDFATGSVVTFRDGVPFRNGYRHFRIKTVRGSNDVEMLAEIAERRYKNSVSLIADRVSQKNNTGQIAKVDAIDDGRRSVIGYVWRGVPRRSSAGLTMDKSARPETPDLILVDGGIAQLNAVSAVISRLKLKVPVISIAKKFEEVLKAGDGKAVKAYMPLTSPALHLLQHVRDEAHRFAIRYHKVLRDREIRSSVLDGIKGIGEKRKQALLGHFGSVDKIKESSAEELKKLGIPAGIARQILENEI